MPSRIRTEPGGLPDLKQVARQVLARARSDDHALSELAEHAADVIVRIGADQRILYINLTGERVYGKPRSAIVGKTIAELGLPRETTKQLREGLEIALSTGATVTPHIELPVRSETIHFQSVFAPEPREDARPGSLLFFARDISDKWRAELAKRQLEAERSARINAEEAMRRSLLLSEVASLLASRPNPADGFQKLAELLVSRIADLCVLDLVGHDGTLKRAAVAHALASKARLAHELLTKFPPRLHVGPGVQEVLASRSPHLFSPSTDAHLVAAAHNDEHLRVLRAIGPRSSIVLPLYAHSRPIGTLGLSITESSRQYTLDDMAFMVELGRQIATAIEHANLQVQTQAARLASERAAHRAKKLLDVTLAISDATSLTEIARRTLEQLGTALDLTSAAFHLL
ncbi:MAG TPA: PAS domain-containing protein, partial [Polyangiaceae bacterium]|nr:PAS domain-containing protein [Polyangiaceae bacterium]